REGIKADLKESKNEGEFQVRELTCDEETAAKIIEAAEKCPVNVIEVIDIKTKESMVNTKLEETKDYREIEAGYDEDKELVLDKKGYFLIRIVPEKKMIEAGFCNSKNKIEVKVSGKKPIDIYQTVLREKIIDRADHAAYLARELQKAYTALHLGIPYVQDDELNLKKQ
ncbi:hypothetical protein COV16_03275, partial [Candidatus Woesearchaeota archaeon CG10_big_fil_rev_8_21_14_0_10_34_8]